SYIALILLRFIILVVILFAGFKYTSKRKDKSVLFTDFIVFLILLIAFIIPTGIILLQIDMYDTFLLITLIGFYFISRLFDFKNKESFKNSVQKVHMKLVFRLSNSFNSIKKKRTSKVINLKKLPH